MFIAVKAPIPYWPITTDADIKSANQKARENVRSHKCFCFAWLDEKMARDFESNLIFIVEKSLKDKKSPLTSIEKVL